MHALPRSQPSSVHTLDSPPLTMTESTWGRKFRENLQWLPSWAWQHVVPRPARQAALQVLVAVADHFEPAIVPEKPGSFAPRDKQEERLERWCRKYPQAMERWRDADGFPLRHTYFYPAEQHDAGLIGRLAEHCQEGWGRSKFIFTTEWAPPTPPPTLRARSPLFGMPSRRRAASRAGTDTGRHGTPLFTATGHWPIQPAGATAE
jgi:hypothetical protein